MTHHSLLDPWTLAAKLGLGEKVKLLPLALSESLGLAGRLPRTSSEQSANGPGWAASEESESGAGTWLCRVPSAIKGASFFRRRRDLSQCVTLNKSLSSLGWSFLLFQISEV